MKSIKIVLLIFIFFSSCNNQNSARKSDVITSSEDSVTRKAGLAPFLSKFKILPNEVLKLNFDGYDTSLTKLDAGSDDTLFIPNCAMGLSYGILADTSKFYALLWYAGVENGALEFTTLDKKGNRIDERQPATGLYGSDCGYYWFGKVFIRKDMTILTRDSLVTFNCDSGVPPETFWKHELDSMDGSINQYGKIIFGKVRQTKLD